MKTLKKVVISTLLVASSATIFNCTTEKEGISSSFNSVTTNAIVSTTRIEAENYTSQSGIRTQTTGDVDGVNNVGWINNGDWIMFESIDLTNNISSFMARVASNTTGGSLELRLNGVDGDLLGQMDVSNTSGWQTWETISTSDLTFDEGIYDVYLVFTGGSGYLYNVNWIEFVVEDDSTGTSELHAAWAEFDENETDIYLEDGLVVVEMSGLPNHTSYYWGEGHELFNENYTLDPARATPSTILQRDNSATYYIDPNPVFADDDSLVETGLNTIGIAVSGAAIFNDQEGTGPLNTGVAAGLDWSGAHIGPGVYHYHLEPHAFSSDDANLVGVLFDGFFIYGRRCVSTATDIDNPIDATYPTDLDEFYGHTHVTQHSDGADEYHYHIQNDVYLDQYYIIKDGYYRGNPLNLGGGGGAGGGPGGGGPGL